jgi:hypothetical protein
MIRRRFLTCVAVCGLFFLNLLAARGETSGVRPNVEQIPGERVFIYPSSPISGSKASCVLEHDDGTALTFFPNWYPGDKNSIYCDPEACDIPYPYPYPFRITGVELLLYNYAEVESVVLKFWVQEVGANICEGPQPTIIYVSPVYTITTFYPDWARVDFTDKICVNGPFFFSIEYFCGTYGTIPGIAMDDQQNLVDSCFQWVWYDPLSPPWREWNLFWPAPDPGWLMARVEGQTYSLECETDWCWLAENGYAPSGMPDLDQNQGDWSAYCAPVAISNSLEWLGVASTLEWSIASLADTVAAYAQSDSLGTEVHNLQTGLEEFFTNYQIDWVYPSTWQMPDFHVMKESLEVSQNIIILLGFWWWDGENWWREGGHFVTMAGVKSEGFKIAVSDPGRDAAEYGWPGRVRPPDHPPPPHDDTLHNDPLYLSHEVYQSDLESPSPANPTFWLPNYLESDPEFPRQYTGQNFPAEFVDFYQSAPPGSTFVTEVEYAVMICPIREHWYWEAPFEDYSPSGMPDFDQKQDGWANPQTEKPSFCGPVAAANCFWWFDSKHNVPPGLPGDGDDLFPLVRDYLDDNPSLIGLDDHDMWNVDHSATGWFPGSPPPATPQPFVPGPQPSLPSWGELVERLAWEMDTDGRRTDSSLVGTGVEDLEGAINVWLSNETFQEGGQLSDTLCGRAWQKPTFSMVNSWVRDDFGVILLLGFWYWNESVWRRVGGHYVTVAGANGAELQIGLSDPFFDNAEVGGLGRVLDGAYISHAPVPHTDSTIHNDAGNVSHDVYSVSQDSISPGGRWWIQDYPASLDPEYPMEIFYQQNVPEEFERMTQPWVTGYPIYTVVEYAVEIRPLDYRGDINVPYGDGSVDVADVMGLVNYIFVGASAPVPYSQGDVNCDGTVDVADVMHLVNYLFLGASEPTCCDP